MFSPRRSLSLRLIIKSNSASLWQLDTTLLDIQPNGLWQT